MSGVPEENPSRDDALLVAGEYAPVPPLLVNATGLETYLGTLSRQLGRDMDTLKKSVNQSTTDAADAKKFILDVRRFLAITTTDLMQRTLLDASAPGGEVDVDEAIQSMIDDHADASETDLVSGVLLVAKKLLTDNDRLKSALAESTRELKALREVEEERNKHLAATEYRLKCHQTDFHNLTSWLGIYDDKALCTKAVPGVYQKSERDTRSASSGGGDGGAFQGQPLLLSASDEDLESTVSRSPLLLAFRRILLRDMVDRVSHVSEIQTRDVGSLVSGLKDDIHQRVTPESVVALMESRQYSDAQTLVKNYAKRLEDIEAAYVKRDELTTALKSKADSVIMPVKADSATVTRLERRVFDKYAELEERVAYFEAERDEFRDVVRTLAALQQQNVAHGPGSSSTVGGKDGGVFPPLLTSARTERESRDGAPSRPAASVHFGEFLSSSTPDPRHLSASGPGRAASTSTGRTDDNTRGKSIYGVLGVRKGSPAAAAPLNPGGEADTLVAELQTGSGDLVRHTVRGKRLQTLSFPSKQGRNVGSGATSGQAPANVENLAVLPYEATQ